MEDCAAECASSKDCRFFIFGTSGSKLGDCYSENTMTASCSEGWETDSFDFYELQAPWIGCAEPRARNYAGEGVVVNDDSCQEWNTCIEGNFDDSFPGACQAWRDWCQQPCPAPSNAGYRNKVNDTVQALRVAPGAIQVDGDLSDWHSQ
eukprot:2532846-Prymnesium_polylepis.1